ncbi:MAG: hypothetical protein KDJ35_01475 [Alphaproteobacteria bacterium]|nr:hypothetical protein [Alphaproteobacteria bacterium]
MQLLRSAQKQLLKLPPETAGELIDALLTYEKKQRGYIKWLEGRPGYRIIIGAYHVVFEFLEAHNEIVVLKILNSKFKPL